MFVAVFELPPMADNNAPVADFVYIQCTRSYYCQRTTSEVGNKSAASSALKSCFVILQISVLRQSHYHVHKANDKLFGTSDCLRSRQAENGGKENYN